MTVLGVLALDQFKDLVIARAFRFGKRVHQSEQEVREWQVRREIPIVGYFLRKQLKPTNWMGEQTNQKAVKGIRWFVNSKSFEHVVSIARQRVTTAGKKKLQRSQPNDLAHCHIDLV